MTDTQFEKTVERLRKYGFVRLPDGDQLILWENGDVSLRNGETGGCIICATNIEAIKRILVST